MRKSYTFVLCMQVALRIFTGSLNMEQLQEQIGSIGPQTLGVSMLTSSFVGMVRARNRNNLKRNIVEQRQATILSYAKIIPTFFLSSTNYNRRPLCECRCSPSSSSESFRVWG